jgi:hypothetical protein
MTRAPAVELDADEHADDGFRVAEDRHSSPTLVVGPFWLDGSSDFAQICAWSEKPTDNIRYFDTTIGTKVQKNMATWRPTIDTPNRQSNESAYT